MQRDSNSQEKDILHKYNEIFLDNIKDILNIKKKVDLYDVRDRVTVDAVKKINEVYAFLWNPDVVLDNVLPEPEPTKLRALYTGLMRPEVILRSIVRYSLYTDDILVVSPFTNPNCMAEKYNPLEHPEQHIDTTLKCVVFMLKLEPWIRAGIVQIIPEPGDFDYPLRMQVFEMAEKRSKSIPKEAFDIHDADFSYSKQDMLRSYLHGPQEYVISLFRRAVPSLKDKSDKEVLKVVNSMKESDPLLSPYVDITKNPQLIMSTSGTNLEMALYIQQLTGSYLYTDMKFRWLEILSALDSEDTTELWSPLTYAFQNLDFRFLDGVNPDFAFRLREEGRVELLRSFVRQTWSSISQTEVISEEKVRTFTDELTNTFNATKSDYDKIDKDLAKWLLSKENLGKVGGAFLSGSLNLILPASANFVTDAIGKLVDSHSKRKTFKVKYPLSVFLELHNKQK